MGKCPEDEDTGTPLYTSDGLRCYTKIGIYKARLTSQDKSTIVDGVRDLVSELAKLRNINTELDATVDRHKHTPPPPI
jgi:hypothetical protein